jgi:long-chain acyl-CoA synthetase
LSIIISGERRLTQAALRERSARAASALRAAGVGAGDAVALLLRNDFAFFEASEAAPLAGAYATPINWHFTAEEVAYILGDCGARVLVVHADLWQHVAGAVPPGVTVAVVPTPPEILAAYGLPASAAAPPAGALLWEGWLAGHPPLAGPAPPPRASMIYTSGTTGRPKGVRKAPMTREQLAMRDIVVARTFGLRAGESTCVLMNGPMYHSAPNSFGLSAARVGAEIVLEPRFDAEDMLALIERHRVTHMHIVPTMFVRLLKLPDAVRRRYDVSSLRFVVHGAAPCPPAVKQAMIRWWGPVINEYYGSTETGIPVWHDSHEALARPGTVGRAVEGAVVRVFDEAGRELPAGEIGEIYLGTSHSPDFTYHGQDDKRQEVGREGLVTVGDVGWVDAEGYVFLCDRKRDMVISGGVNIYPAEIEVVLAAMPGVKDCAVFGIPDEEFGESLCAHVEPEPEGPPLTVEAVRAYLGATLAKYKIPRVVEFATALPREDSGKIFKRKLRAPYWEKLDRSI